MQSGRHSGCNGSDSTSVSADHRLDVRECAVLQQRIRVFRLVLAGDDVDFVVLLALAALAVGLVLTRLVRKNTVTSTGQSSSIGFRQRVHSLTNGATRRR